MHNYIALAIPFFFALIALEVAIARLKHVRVYRFTDAITDLSCGITSQMAYVVWGATQTALYAALYEHHHVLTLPPLVAWVLAFVAVDFLYYWWHRLSHEVNFLWAAHVVHHQSEDYNLAVALRQAVLTSWTSLPFYLPLALLGVPTIVFATIYSFSTLYQFWIHTELVGKVKGPIDRVLNLPSHHRVHHAINPQYLDKNYGATLIVWDRIFGTYEEEVEPPVFGITKALATYDALWAQVHYWFEIAQMSAGARGMDKLRAFWKSPAWRPRNAAPVETKPVSAATRPKYDPPITRAKSVYVFAQYVLLVTGTFVVVLYQAILPLSVRALAIVAIVGAVFSIGALIERRWWAPAAEATRLAVGALAIAMWLRT
jgi:sterol desaturase/sphingolipid hydroxylase (fatty acid hydroxylase superfamily)